MNTPQKIILVAFVIIAVAIAWKGFKSHAEKREIQAKQDQVTKEMSNPDQYSNLDWKPNKK